MALRSTLSEAIEVSSAESARTEGPTGTVWAGWAGGAVDPLPAHPTVARSPEAANEKKTADSHLDRVIDTLAYFKKRGPGLVTPGS